MFYLRGVSKYTHSYLYWNDSGMGWHPNIMYATSFKPCAEFNKEKTKRDNIILVDWIKLGD